MLDSKSFSSRKPKQDRSVASLNRMFNATMKLLFERQCEDFTLQEVSAEGGVSIGSIYYRFKSKDDLVREVIAHGLANMASKEEDSINRLLEECNSLQDYVPRYISEYADILKQNELLLRLSMTKASSDNIASQRGNSQMENASKISTNALLQFRDEIHGNPDLKARIVFQTAFATLARNLSLDTKDDQQLMVDWSSLVSELGMMSLAYLVKE
ncbi:MAG: TetR/AcrR family transcriptional regulator [Oceanospirillaceae bacterium]|nr:TetR/AcrR family transcriptional regulator [Oceanospirillaceae bacterium]